MLVHALPAHEDQSFPLVKRCNFFKALFRGCGEQGIGEDCAHQECQDGLKCREDPVTHSLTCRDS
ncbi:19866_t:CDS:2 [Cetraspora pellucida]|uniref:19866_t:CDS:1 n=1 Tax=Cetraspora pellucida TaxID=1433469 RepID=A0A9N8VRN7_9GLOM|nr:19866_t:CDS:2 [Cetraspora pellucida]